jgi:sugar phosphate isomerase/epimerase
VLRFATKFVPQRVKLENAYQAGFRHAEIWLNDALLADWDGVARLAGDYPFEYALHFPNAPAPTAVTLAGAVALYRRLGCRCMVIHQPLFDRCAADLLRLEPGLRLAVENHKLSPQGFGEWADRNPGLALDVEHLWKFTLADAPLESLRRHVRSVLSSYRDKLRHVHLPGYWPGFMEHRPLYCARDMAFPILSLLAEHDYDGLVVSEANAEYQTAQELRMDVLLFEAWRINRQALPA